jgi:2-dehydropantoate 2-reductase
VTVRYILIGPGGIGGTVGGLLARAGRDVVLVARSANLEALRTQGLTVATPAGTFTVQPPAVAGPAEVDLRDGDAILLAVKSQDTAAILDDWNWRPVAGGAGSAADCVPVFCFQNGVENERMAARRFTAVYGVGVQMPAELTGPGQVMAPGSPVAGLLEIGRYPAGSDAAAEELAADLAAAGFAARVSDRVMVGKHAKLLRNLRNAIIAACGSMTSAAAQGVAAMAVAEAEACYAAAGIEYLSLAEANAAREDIVREVPVGERTRGGGSTWQSLNRGAGTAEVDYLNGEIVLLGLLHGVPTPVNELLRQTVSAMAARREAPGTIDPEVLLAQARERRQPNPGS